MFPYHKYGNKQKSMVQLMNTLVSSGFSSIKSYIVINIDIDQYPKNNRDNIFCNIAQPYP